MTRILIIISFIILIALMIHEAIIYRQQAIIPYFTDAQMEAICIEEGI